MTDIALEAFETEALAQGFDEVAPRQWPGGQVVDEHTHPEPQAERYGAGGDPWWAARRSSTAPA